MTVTRDSPLPPALTPSLSWLHPWAQTLTPRLRTQLERVECAVENSPMDQQAPLLTVMEYYNLRVNPSCPHQCSCHFYHFVERPEDSYTFYTVRANCSGHNLTAFPSLPAETTVLDLSNNLLEQAAYTALDVVSMNYTFHTVRVNYHFVERPEDSYINLESLILSHNSMPGAGAHLLLPAETTVLDLSVLPVGAPEPALSLLQPGHQCQPHLHQPHLHQGPGSPPEFLFSDLPPPHSSLTHWQCHHYNNLSPK